MDFPKKQAQRLIPLYLLEYSEELFENHPDPSASWGGGSDYTAGYGIDITNNEIRVDQTEIATKNDLNGYIKDNDLNYSSTFRGQGAIIKEQGAYTATFYNDGTIARSIPNQPGYTYTLPNATGTLALTSDIPSLTNYVTTTQLEDALDDYALSTDIPTDVSQLNNDAGYTTQTWVQNQGYITGITSSDVVSALGYTPGTSNFSGSYNDLSDKPTNLVTTDTDQSITGNKWFNSGHLIVQGTSLGQKLFFTPYAFKYRVGYSGIDFALPTSKTSGTPEEPTTYTLATTDDIITSYNDLTDKPTIPTVNNPTITFTQGGTTKGTITLNQSGDQTIALDAGGGGGGTYTLNKTTETLTFTYSDNTTGTLTVVTDVTLVQS